MADTIKDVITAAEWSVRQQQWAEYRRWAASEAPPEIAAEDAIANVGAILEWIPEPVRGTGGLAVTPT